MVWLLQPMFEAEEATAYWGSQGKWQKPPSVLRMLHGLGGLENGSLVAGYWIQGESRYVLLTASWEKYHVTGSF